MVAKSLLRGVRRHQPTTERAHGLLFKDLAGMHSDLQTLHLSDSQTQRPHVSGHGQARRTHMFWYRLQTAHGNTAGSGSHYPLRPGVAAETEKPYECQTALVLVPETGVSASYIQCKDTMLSPITPTIWVCYQLQRSCLRAKRPSTAPLSMVYSRTRPFPFPGAGEEGAYLGVKTAIGRSGTGGLQNSSQTHFRSASTCIRRNVTSRHRLFQ